MIQTADDWWKLLDRNWVKILGILYRFLPMNDHQDIEGRIMEHPLWLHVVEMREFRSPVIARYLQAAWSMAPDSPAIHRIPGWNALCNLCSENEVLYENNNKTD